MLFSVCIASKQAMSPAPGVGDACLVWEEITEDLHAFSWLLDLENS